MQLKPLEWKDPPEKDKESFGTIAICRVLGLEYQILTMNDDLINNLSRRVGFNSGVT